MYYSDIFEMLGGEGNTPSKKKHSKKCEICEIKYSAAGDVVAVGCKDNLVHLLSVNSAYKHTAVCRGHSACVRTIDFSADGVVLQTSDASKELMHWETQTGKRLLNAAQFRDVIWNTYNSIYGWSVQGVFNNSEGEKIRFLNAIILHDQYLCFSEYYLFILPTDLL